jgi:L-lactate dehydrogenase (cytochrome)
LHFLTGLIGFVSAIYLRHFHFRTLVAGLGVTCEFHLRAAETARGPFGRRAWRRSPDGPPARSFCLGNSGELAPSASSLRTTSPMPRGEQCDLTEAKGTDKPPLASASALANRYCAFCKSAIVAARKRAASPPVTTR